MEHFPLMIGFFFSLYTVQDIGQDCFPCTARRFSLFSFPVDMCRYPEPSAWSGPRMAIA
jgi:hypothetical protein